MNKSDDRLLVAWQINDCVTRYLLEHLEPSLWNASLPGSPRRTVRSVGAHFHNVRCMWVSCLANDRTSIPARVDPRKATRREVLAALACSGRSVGSLVSKGTENGGTFPGVRTPFVWGAIPRDTTLFIGYALSHEAHHRGQLVMLARQLGYRLPPKAIAGLWQWSSRMKD